MNCSFLVNANLSSQLVLTDEPNWKVLPKKVLLLFVLELAEFLKPFFFLSKSIYNNLKTSDLIISLSWTFCI